MDWTGILTGGLMSAGKALWDQKETGRAKAYATKMSNSAHQREVKDLRAAGLNPILSAGGSGASTPTIGATPGPDPGSNVAALTNASTGKAAMKASVRNTNAVAEGNEIQAAFDRDLLAFYNSDPKIKSAFLASRLTDAAGGNKPVSAIAGGFSSARKALAGVGRDAVNSLNSASEKRRYDNMNREGLSDYQKRVIERIKMNDPRKADRVYLDDGSFYHRSK